MFVLAALIAGAAADAPQAPAAADPPPQHYTVQAPPATAAGPAPRQPGWPVQRMLPLGQRAVPAAATPPGKPTREQVLAAVRAEWPTYDSRHQGRLGPLEFGTWVMRANGAAVQPPGSARGTGGVKPVTAMNVTSAAFAKADANHDGGVTPEEMAAFLAR